MKKSLLFIAATCFSFLLFAQAELKPSIGIGDLPADATPVCDIPLYLGDFESTGLQVGDTLFDFNLFSIDNEELDLGEWLEDDLPVLLVNGSYTCPVFRGKVGLINQLAIDYAGLIKVAIIYTVEAHPSGDISPYFGFENVGNANMQEGILYNQPTTYGERKSIVSDMLGAMTIEVPVFLDGPCNNWWEVFGPAPNNAYLINTDGLVAAKHGWFDKYPYDIKCDIDELLGIPNDCDLTFDGSFEFTMESDTLAEGVAGATLSVYGLLSNNSNGGVEIEIGRLTEAIPADWATSMCLDICYATDVDYTTIHLEPGEEQSYTMYFYTGDSGGSGMTKMGFRNINNLQNRYVQRMYASTSLTAVNETELSPNVAVFPNPAVAYIHLDLTKWRNGSGAMQLFLYDSAGKPLMEKSCTQGLQEIDVSQLPVGLYWLSWMDESGRAGRSRFVKI